jgi:CheY-like chemotaxis protein
VQLSEAKQALFLLFRRLRGLPPQERERVEAEIAEILLYIVRTANRFGINLAAVAGRQLAHDAKRQPRAASDGHPALFPVAASTDQRTRILIVEDEGIVAADLQEVLNGLGHNAYAIAASGEEALAIARETRPDVALVDIRIEGELDGIELATRLRREFSTAVIYITALADDSTVHRAKSSDAYAYLVKPVSLPALRATIDLTVNRHRQLLAGSGA